MSFNLTILTGKYNAAVTSYEPPRYRAPRERGDEKQSTRDSDRPERKQGERGRTGDQRGRGRGRDQRGRGRGNDSANRNPSLSGSNSKKDPHLKETSSQVNIVTEEVSDEKKMNTSLDEKEPGVPNSSEDVVVDNQSPPTQQKNNAEEEDKTQETQDKTQEIQDPSSVEENGKVQQDAEPLIAKMEHDDVPLSQPNEAEPTPQVEPVVEEKPKEPLETLKLVSNPYTFTLPAPLDTSLTTGAQTFVEIEGVLYLKVHSTSEPVPEWLTQLKTAFELTRNPPPPVPREEPEYVKFKKIYKEVTKSRQNPPAQQQTIEKKETEEAKSTWKPNPFVMTQQAKDTTAKKKRQRGKKKKLADGEKEHEDSPTTSQTS